MESVAFVPPGLTLGGAVYYSDRVTPNNPHPGTDSLLRLAGSAMAAAGVHDGDLLAATEGGARMIAVSCQATCLVASVVGTPSTSHGEGHIAFTVEISPSSTRPVASPTPTPASPGGNPGWRLVAIVALTGAAVASALAIRSRLSKRL